MWRQLSGLVNEISQARISSETPIILTDVLVVFITLPNKMSMYYLECVIICYVHILFKTFFLPIFQSATRCDLKYWHYLRVNNQFDALFYVFISLLYMFRATQCPSSAESIVSMHHLVYITMCRWPSVMQVRKELHRVIYNR